ncbi:carboxypeptidase C (cathepsin A) [Phycicoccus badiiscoriae]|uniref:Carboxypeptidase C (Cathepsin A) n=1 Tax=Pedococcus badiiscoriae TaxID=642776 RepID=A0A852WEB1_9MICO|nr:peptidase S10 [Pedococcus badiiscoriae]NYG07553.1 carboxypeptidase C (cathepsin A) [Pedococcus badiiscoriae]
MPHESTHTPAPVPAASSASPAASDTEPATSADAPTTPAPQDDLVTTRHTLKIGRKTLRYTATAGRMVLREEVFEDGVFKGHNAKAELSVTSYVLDAPAGSRRPVTFAFNGGPGSSSVWLHLGLLGPRRVDSGDVGNPTPPPYGLLDNTETLLAVSDLVFIDPVSTGYSRAVEGGKPKDYHGFKADIESVGELIRLWTTRHNRWLSPKFIAGESYGTIRAAALAEHLQARHGLFVNGIMLISSVLDVATVDFEFRNDRAHVDYLPTYAAAAHYHGKHGRKSLHTVLAEAEEYAARDYPWALSRGSRLTAAERAEHVGRLAALTGLSEGYVDRADLRIEHVRFFTELLRDQGLAVGRLDARFTGPLVHANAEKWDADPSHDAISGPYAAAWNHYVRDELGYENDLPYAQISELASTEWSFKEFEGKPIDVSSQLARAMRGNPHLRVHIAYGYHDGATPYYGAQDAVAHLEIPASLRANVEDAYYEAGHMMYVHEPSRLQQSKDLASFVTRFSGVEPSRAGSGGAGAR